MINLKQTDHFTIFISIVNLHLEQISQKHVCLHTETEYEVTKKWLEQQRANLCNKAYYSAALEIVRSRMKKK